MATSRKKTYSEVVASAISDNAEGENYINQDDSVTPTKIMKIRKYQLHPKTYSTKWEQDPNYKGWVQRSKKGDGYYYCLACNQDYTCGKSELDKHASSKKHCMNMMSLPKTVSYEVTKINNQNNFIQESNFNSTCDSFETDQEIIQDSQHFDSVSFQSRLKTIARDYCFNDLFFFF